MYDVTPEKISAMFDTKITTKVSIKNKIFNVENANLKQRKEYMSLMSKAYKRFKDASFKKSQIDKLSYEIVDNGHVITLDLSKFTNEDSDWVLKLACGRNPAKFNLYLTAPNKDRLMFITRNPMAIMEKHSVFKGVLSSLLNYLHYIDGDDDVGLEDDGWNDVDYKPSFRYKMVDSLPEKVGTRLDFGDEDYRGEGRPGFTIRVSGSPEIMSGKEAMRRFREDMKGRNIVASGGFFRNEDGTTTEWHDEWPLDD